MPDPGEPARRSQRTPVETMIEPRSDRLPAQAPAVSAPRLFVERRVNFRRAEDQIAHAEKVLLARALDVLASDLEPEARLAGLLRLLARTVGARRAAVVSDGIERRAAVAVDPGENPDEAEALAAWLDAHAPRSRARRAATGRAPISFIVGASDEADLPDGVDDFFAAAEGPAEDGAPAPERWQPAVAGTIPTDGLLAPTSLPGRHYAMVPIPSAGGVVLGFAFGRPADAARLANRLPPTLARHAAVAMALVTSQLATERELADLRAREAERTTFVSTVAHELRTPLTGLRGYLELILAGGVGDPAIERDFLDRSRAIVDSMGELVGDLLDLSRMESGALVLELGPFSIAEAAQQVARGLHPIAIERDVRLTTDLPPRLRTAIGDRRRVEQILTNLTANALKFTPRGGTVQIAARPSGVSAVFVVRDNGAGIPADDRGRIFEQFHRMAAHERVTGTGLGLPIARELARRMNGDLDVASVPGAGSAFVLVLPGPADGGSIAIEQTMGDALDRELGELQEALARRPVDSSRREPNLRPERAAGRTGRARRARSTSPDPGASAGR